MICDDYLHGNQKCSFFLPRVAELEIFENLALLLFPVSFSCGTLCAMISKQLKQCVAAPVARSAVVQATKRNTVVTKWMLPEHAGADPSGQKPPIQSLQSDNV